MKKMKKKLLVNIIIIIISILKINSIISFNLKEINELYIKKYHILVDIEESKMYIFEKADIIKIYDCSGGKSDTPSPIGNWEITFKALWGEGYGGRFMGINCPWGQFGIHGTPIEDSIGKKSSHGCIRMKIKDIEELYSFINVGTPVTIIDGEYRNFGKGFRYLESGMYGSDVFEIQKMLRNLGFLRQEPNGKFDYETEKAIELYCIKNGLKTRKYIDIDLQKKMGFILME